MCLEPVNEGDRVVLPGCRHRFHCACILSSAQFDVRCPVCRAVPKGVIPRARDPERAERGRVSLSIGVTASDPSAVHFHALPTDAGGLVEINVPAVRRFWRLFRTLRSRMVQASTEAREATMALRRVKRLISTSRHQLDRAYAERCRWVWEHDPVLKRLRDRQNALTRRANVLRRSLYALVDRPLRRQLRRGWD